MAESSRWVAGVLVPRYPDRAMAIVELDLTGVPCPLNWAKAKVRLESLGRDETLAVLIDDPRGVRDIPRAAAAEGYDVIDVEPAGAAWRITIQR